MHEGEGTGVSESQKRAIRAELDRLLESAAFRTSNRCKEFLKYVVEHTIDGSSNTLKERAIGIGLFQLPPDFDTGQHTIVRVTANEVRKRLAQHYFAENHSNHPVRIDLPPGSYSVEFKWGASATEPKVPARPSWLIPTVLLCAAAFMVIGGVILLWPEQAKNLITPAGSSTPVPSTVAKASAGEDLRIIAGATDPYVDRSGRTWSPDRFFSGGSLPVGASVGAPERVFRTLDPDIYRHGRQGEFRYDIPLAPGAYELHLHFAETGLADFISAESSGEGQRLFKVWANGKQILDLFDIVADAAGAHISNERVFRDIAPDKDGSLHLRFVPQRGLAILHGIEVLLVSPGKVRPIRIRAGWPTSWRDSAGQEWRADSYFWGGNALVRARNPVQASGSASPDVALYTSERWGHFSYALPVAEGRYRVTLKFCEAHYGPSNTGLGGLGSRVFDVYCNGVALLRNFDIFKEARGEGRPVQQTFSGIRPNAQGKILLDFVPVVKMACVNAIEIAEDSE
jgi:hypothetical protein